MLTSLSWPFLLLGFALASIGWTFWSYSQQLRRESEQQLPPPVVLDSNRRRRDRTTANIYAFPAQEYNQSIPTN
jgi:hypothetical protein